MDFFNLAVNMVLRGITGVFSWAPPAVSLFVISVLIGIGMLWVFRKTSDQAKIQAVKRRVHACLLELRAYSEEPAITWRAQKTLMSANLRYMALALRPALWMALPLALLLIHMEAFYGRAPLTPGNPAIVTAGMRSGVDHALPDLAPPAGVEISSPPVWVLDAREVTWRIRPVTAVSGKLQFRINGQSFTKRIEAGGSPRFVAGRSVRSAWGALWHPDEARISADEVEWVEIHYPEAYVRFFGVSLNWLIWFLLISMLSALILRKRFGVTL